jgi:hypothetical protein
MTMENKKALDSLTEKMICYGYSQCKQLLDEEWTWFMHDVTNCCEIDEDDNSGFLEDGKPSYMKVARDVERRLQMLLQRTNLEELIGDTFTDDELDCYYNLTVSEFSIVQKGVERFIEEHTPKEIDYAKQICESYIKHIEQEAKWDEKINEESESLEIEIDI